MSNQFGQCAICQAELIRTSERYACCPNGHGKLSPWPSHKSGRTLAAEDKKIASAWEKAFRELERAEKRLGYRIVGWTEQRLGLPIPDPWTG